MSPLAASSFDSVAPNSSQATTSAQAVIGHCSRWWMERWRSTKAVGGSISCPLSTKPRTIKAEADWIAGRGSGLAFFVDEVGDGERMFIDEVKIYARAGHGGKGCVAFH